MRRGGTLPAFELAWESWGTLNDARDNAIVILTGLSPNAHVASNAQDPDAGWWEFMVGPGRPIDTNRWFVVCANSLGSCLGSTGPASVDPRSGAVYGTAFPELALEDIALATRLLVRSLGIEQVAVLVGPSMGGMTALAWCAQFPGEVRFMVNISSAPHATPFTIALRSLQREAIRTDPAYREGRYHGTPGPINGMRLARKLGMMSYRSAEEWLRRFGRKRIEDHDGTASAFSPEFQVEAYLEAAARRFIGSFDPNCYLYLSRAMDWFDIGSYGTSVPDALAALRLERALVLGVDTDLLFPLHQQRAIAEGLRRGGTLVEFHALPSLQGHDAFLVDDVRFGPVVGEFLHAL